MTSFLAKFRVLTKILAVIVLMASITIGLSWLGIHALSSLNDGAETMSRSAKRSLEAARANQNVVAMNRAEFSVALDPRPENRVLAHKTIEQELKAFHQRMEDVSATTDEQAKALATGAKEAMALYEQDMENTLRLADETTDVKLSDQTMRLRDAALKSEAAAEKLRASVRAVADRLDNRVDYFAAAATEEYESVSRIMIIAALLGIVLGISAGFMVGQFGIARPMRMLVGLLQRLAKGEDIEITGTDRKDEVGETAKAVNEIKIMLAEKALQEAEAKIKQDEMAAAQRKTDMLKLADGFENAVGEIIETVSSASTELEASATTLTSTAQRGQELTTMVAAASEEASTNVQSVASRDRGTDVVCQ